MKFTFCQGKREEDDKFLFLYFLIYKEGFRFSLKIMDKKNKIHLYSLTQKTPLSQFSLNVEVYIKQIDITKNKLKMNMCVTIT